LGLAPATWEEDERSHRSGVGRWAFAHGEFSLTVVLKVAGLPEPPDNEPSDTIPFFVLTKSMGLERFSE